MPDWQVLRETFARAQGPILTEKDRVRLRCAGVLYLLAEVARGNKFALEEIEKFDHWTHDFIRSKIEEGDIDFEVVTGALIVSLPRGVVSDTQVYLDFLANGTEPALAPAALFALQRFPVHRAKWKSFGMDDVGAIEWIGARFNGDGGDDFDDKFDQRDANEAQDGGHLWAVLFCLINCMAQAFFPGDHHFPSVVTQEYFAKAVEAFAIVVDFRVFTNAVRDLFVIFFALLIHAFSAEELPLVGFTLPYAGGNMANKFCRQVGECGPIAAEFCWKLLGEPNYLFGATTVPRDIFDRLVRNRPLGVYYTRDYLRYGWRFATAFNLLDDPLFFLKWLRHFWEEAQEGEEAEFTEGLPIRKNFKCFELDGIRLFFRRFLVLSPGCAFSLGTIQCIPGAMTFESPVEGFTLGGLARFLEFAEGSKRARTSALGAMIFASNEQKIPLPIELIKQIFSQAFQSLGEFLHLNRRTPLDYMHDQLAQCQGNLLLTARCDLQQAELRRVAVETELQEEKVRVARLLREREERALRGEERALLVAQLLQEREELALRGEKRAASGAAVNSPARKVHRPPEPRQVEVSVTYVTQGHHTAPPAEHVVRSAPPVAMPPDKLPLPSIGSLDTTLSALDGGSPHSRADRLVLPNGVPANSIDPIDGSSSGEESGSEEESGSGEESGSEEESGSGEESGWSDSEEDSSDGGGSDFEPPRRL